MSVIWAAWRSHKIIADDVVKELTRSRDRGAVSALQQVDIRIRRSNTLDMAEIAKVQSSLEGKQSAFLEHPVITKFLAQFQERNYSVEPRAFCLLLAGDSRQGKSTKAMSLFNIKHTLKVSCQDFRRACFRVWPDLTDASIRPLYGMKSAQIKS